MFFCFLFAKRIDENTIKEFLWMRYEADTNKISLFLSNDFLFYHPPIIGLGINVKYQDGYFSIMDNFRKDSSMFLTVGDKIYEINNKKISETSMLPKGPVGALQKIILTKKEDSIFTKIDVPLVKSNYKENKISFLQSIINYSNQWYDFDIEIYETLLKKNKAFIYYKWEGSKEENGKVYSFYSMELIKLDKKKKYIKSIETIWTKDLFLNQFLY